MHPRVRLNLEPRAGMVFTSASKMNISIRDLMASSGVAFGTSGARGLAAAMTDQVCYAYTGGFLQYLEAIGELKRAGERVAVGGDFRPSTDRVMLAVMQAAADRGYSPVNCGKMPSPAVALFGLVHKIPALMVTGSHIPDDRNGIKFNKCTGEVLKSDEAGMAGQTWNWTTGFLMPAAGLRHPAATRPVSPRRPRNNQRYLNVFPRGRVEGPEPGGLSTFRRGPGRAGENSRGSRRGSHAARTLG